MNKKYYVYKTTNLINNKFYIGVHSTNKKHDYYLGSGKHLKISIKKYGKNNFNKEIIEYFNNYEDALNKEKEIVTEDFIKRKDTYNIICGGGMPPIKYGNNHHFFGRRLFGIDNPSYGKKHSEYSKKIMSEIKKGTKLSKETKIKLSLLKKGKTPKNFKEIKEKRQRNWQIITPENYIINTKDIVKFCKENNLQAENLRAVAYGKRIHHKGYKCVVLSKETG